jgi:hypothetical protein
MKEETSPGREWKKELTDEGREGRRLVTSGIMDLSWSASGLWVVVGMSSPGSVIGRSLGAKAEERRECGFFSKSATPRRDVLSCVPVSLT